MTQPTIPATRTFPSHDGRTLIKGCDLRVRDTINPLGSPRHVVRLTPYDGPLDELQGARVAHFAGGGSMTVMDDMRLEICDE